MTTAEKARLKALEKQVAQMQIELQRAWLRIVKLSPSPVPADSIPHHIKRLEVVK